MTETGKVREVNGNLVVITVDRINKNDESDSCFGCMKMECKNQKPEGPLGRYCITAKNTKALLLNTNQTVEVQAKGISFLGQALTAFLPPIFGFIAGYAIIRFFFPEAGEAAFAGAGVIFLFAAAFIAYVARKKSPQKEIYTVTRIITDTFS